MEQKNSDDDNDEEVTPDQIKLKAQEIAKHFEKYQGRYPSSSSRCNTPLPIAAAESIESINSNSVISDTSEKVLLFRQFLENGRKLVEDDKIDESKINNDGKTNDDKLLDVQQQSEKDKLNSKYYDDIISAQLNEKNIQSLKNQVFELNEKLKKCHNAVIEKDVLLQSKIDKIELLNNSLAQKNKLHLETVEALKQRNIEIINEERSRCNQKINHIVEETDNLKQNLDYIHQVYDELKQSNVKIDKENTELRKKEKHLKSEIEKLTKNHEIEKKLLLQQNLESSKTIIEGMEKELQLLRQEKDSLITQINSFEDKPTYNHENDNLLTELKVKETDIERLNLENKKLSQQYHNQTIEVQEMANRWTQLKDAYLNDKNRMTFLEKVVEELKFNNDELNSTNVKLTQDIERSVGDVTTLKHENIAHHERITDLMAVIENMRSQFEKALKDASIEYEQDKKQLIQQYKNGDILLETCNSKLEESTSRLNNVTNQLNIVLKENNLYKNELLELNNCIGSNHTKISELNHVISDLHKQLAQSNNELEFLKKENTNLFDKTNGISLEKEEYKLLLDKFQKQKQLLKVKIKALKESENNCLLLQQQIVSLTSKTEDLNQRSEYLVQCNKQVNTVLQNCDTELQNCYDLLKKILIKSNVQDQIIHTLRYILLALASLFSFDDINVDDNMLKVVDSIANNVSFDNELQTCLKKTILGAIQIFEYIIRLKVTHKLTNAQLIARSEVDSLMSEAVEKVRMSTQNQYYKQNNEQLILIENLQSENYSLKQNIASNTRVLETKEVLTNLHGPSVSNLLSLENVNVKNIKNENETLKQFLRNIQQQLGLVNFEELHDEHLLSYLNELQVIVQEIKNENLLLKNQCLENQKLLALKTMEQPIHQQISYSNLNTQSSSNRAIENAERNYGTDEKVSAVNDDQKMLLLRYKNLKSKFKEVRTKTIELDKKVVSLTNDLECANSKYKQLNDQFDNSNKTHEIDIANCQSEIKNLMAEKIEANCQLTELKEKHEILQNDYEQLQSNLDDKICSNNIDKSFTQTSEQISISKDQSNYTNLQSEFDEVCAKTVELNKKIVSLTNDLECANLKYKQLNDQFVSSNETYEIDITNCQSEIENLMTEKIEANCQLSALKEKHLILQNDYEQLKSNLGEKIGSNDVSMPSAYTCDQNTILNDQLNNTNLQSQFNEVCAKTVELDKTIVSLNNDLERANLKYKQLNDQFVSSNETYEIDIINCQSEIENLMTEKIEANRQLSTLKEKHEILQNDYDQLKSNLDDKISFNYIDTHVSEQITTLKGQLNDMQHLIDSAYSRVLHHWPPIDDSSDWVAVQSRKLDEIVDAKCSSSVQDFDFEESEVDRLKTCVQTIHDLISSILTNKYIEEPSTNEIVYLISELKSSIGTFLEFISSKNNELNLVDKRHIVSPQHVETFDSSMSLSNQLSSAKEPTIIKSVLSSTVETLKPSANENEKTEQLQQAIVERDRLIGFLSEKISKVDNISRNIDDIRLLKDKLDRALTAVHDRDVRCDELTLELTRLLEERDMLQLKLSNSIRQIQFLSDNKPNHGTSNSFEDKYGSKNIDDKLEELHSLEYRRDADLFTDQEQRHKSQMQLHQTNQDSSTAQENKTSTATGAANTSQSWFKDILW